jgi:hypothetical protein
MSLFEKNASYDLDRPYLKVTNENIIYWTSKYHIAPYIGLSDSGANITCVGGSIAEKWLSLSETN